MNELQSLPALNKLIKFRVDHRTVYWVNEDVFLTILQGEESSFWNMTSIKRLQISDVAIIGGALVKFRFDTVECLMDTIINTRDVFEYKDVPVIAPPRSGKHRIIGKRPK